MPPTLRRRPTPELDPLRESRAASPPPSPPGSSYSQAGVRGGQQRGRGRLIKRGGMEPREGKRQGSGTSGREAGGEQAAVGCRAPRLLSPAPLRRSRGTAASAGPLPRGLPSPSPAAAPLHRAAPRIPARPYPPAPGSEKAGTPRAAAGLEKLAARLTLPCLPPAPPPLPVEPRWPPGFLRAEPSSDMNRKGPPPARPRRGGRRRRLVAKGCGGAGAAASGAGTSASLCGDSYPRPPAQSSGGRSAGALSVPGVQPPFAPRSSPGLGYLLNRPSGSCGAGRETGKSVSGEGSSGVGDTTGQRGRGGGWRNGSISSAGEEAQGRTRLPHHSREQECERVDPKPPLLYSDGQGLVLRSSSAKTCPPFPWASAAQVVCGEEGSSGWCWWSSPGAARRPRAIMAPCFHRYVMLGSFGGGGWRPRPSKHTPYIQ